MVKKSPPRKYWLFNIAVELDQVTIQDANLSVSANKFLEEFASYPISFFINFSFGYDQLELANKCQDLTIFMTLFWLIQMTTLAQIATNFVSQYVKIVLKILAHHLQNEAKLFTDDVKVKKPKTT